MFVCVCVCVCVCMHVSRCLDPLGFAALQLVCPCLVGPSMQFMFSCTGSTEVLFRFPNPIHAGAVGAC